MRYLGVHWISLVAVSASLLSPAPVAQAQTPLTTERVVAGLDRPVQVAAPPGDRDRLFIVEQKTQAIWIYKFETGELNADPFIWLGDRANGDSNEMGLLGLAFHPDYANNGYFYVNYTRDPDGATMVERFEVRAGNPDRAKKSTSKVILGPVDQPFSNHNGGCLRFGPNDGYLYIAFGDGGSAGDPGCRAQRGDTFLGKLLRIDVDSGDPYGIPPDNPFLGDSSVLDEIWSLGLRNPWRFDFDPANGDIYIGDVGQNAREEISFSSGLSVGGENYGWKMMEGNNCYSTSSCPGGIPACDDPVLVDPILDYGHGNGCSVTGGTVYRGCAIPDLRGTYFFADYCSDRIWSFRYDDSKLSEFQERTNELDPAGASIDSISSIDVVDGEIYFSDLGGEIFKLVANAPPPAEDLGFGKGDAAGTVPEFTACGLLDTGNEAELRLRRVPAGTLAVLAASTQMNPTNLWGGTLVPFPLQSLTLFVTNGAGEVEFVIPGGGGPVDVYAQYVIADPAATFETTFSNALKIMFQQ